MTVTESAADSAAKSSAPPAVSPPVPKEVLNAQPVPWRFALLVAQLALLLFIIKGLNLDQSAKFSLSFALCVYGYVAFVVHYWLPVHLKKTGFVLLSMGAVFAALGPQDWLDPATTAFSLQLGGAAKFLLAAVVLALVFFGSLRLPIPFWFRMVPVLAVAVGLIYLRASDGRLSTAGRSEEMWLSNTQWAFLGAIFMFRMILYAKEVKIARQPEKFADFMCYFFLLPNLFFPLFPVVDYTTFKRGHYARNIHDTAQKGIFWMARGVTHFCIYRVLYQNQIAHTAVQDFGMLFLFLFQFYLQYTMVSGLFHFMIGMLHLFGWELPETNRKYLLASGFTDFWRRINIYWKDFMIKAFYYPAYFKLRRYNERLALIVATLVVFVATTVLHGYQLFWIKGSFEIHPRDYLFWGALGVIVMVSVLYEARRGRPKKRSKPIAMLIRVGSSLGVFVTISLLWSMWSMTLGEWWDVVTYVFEKSFQ